MQVSRIAPKSQRVRPKMSLIDAAGLPVVLRALQARGYSDDRLERICNGNCLRVAAGVWR